MGEYATDQMMHDYKQMTGVNADREDFESEKKPRKLRPKCVLCVKVFHVSQAVADHMRNKHATLPPASPKEKN